MTHLLIKQFVKGCRHSSVDLSAPSILTSQVWVPSTPSMHFSIYKVQIVYLSRELECENNENKQKEDGIGPFKENQFLKWMWDSVTRLVDSLHFGQLFKACSNNYFAHILGNFIEDVKICHFSSEIVLDNFFRDICQLSLVTLMGDLI